jgi:hypothetical protein
MLTSGLNLQLFAAFLEGRQSLLGVARQVNMHASSHTVPVLAIFILYVLNVSLILHTGTCVAEIFT